MSGGRTVGDDVLVVQLGDVTQSKKRSEESDAASSTSGNYSFNPLMLQPFAISPKRSKDRTRLVHMASRVRPTSSWLVFTA